MSDRKLDPLSAHKWNEEWKALQDTRRSLDTVDYWNRRAETFKDDGSSDEYALSFLQLAQIGEHECILDMGCGGGAMSIPLGRQGHTVFACDYSKEMLAVLDESLRVFGITTVSPKLLSWEDNWEFNGLGEGSVDVALASRSMLTNDLKESLLKLDRVSRRRVCLTLATEGSPRIDQGALEAIGLEREQGRDHEFALGILGCLGIEPELDFIVSTKKDSFSSEEEAFKKYKRMIDDVGKDCSDSEKAEHYEHMREWLRKHLVEQNISHVVGAPKEDRRFCLDKPRENTWAFIAWNKN